MANRTSKISRDIECWYCKKGQHSRCALGLTCACYTCYPVEQTACGGLCKGICNWSCFSKRTEGDDALSQQASYYIPA